MKKRDSTALKKSWRAIFAQRAERIIEKYGKYHISDDYFERNNKKNYIKNEPEEECNPNEDGE